MLQAIRFFIVVRVVPASMIAALTLFTVAGCILIAVDARRAASALTPVLLLQLFASASGFRVPARRGHYDLLLTGGAGRVPIAAGHWVTSVLPGVLGWLARAASEHAAGAHLLTASGTLVAVVAVSTIPWAVTMPLPRLSGAIAWLVLCLTAGTFAPGGGDVGTGLLLPWSVIGAPLRGVDAYIAAAIGVAGVCSVAAAILGIERMDVPLESSQ